MQYRSANPCPPLAHSVSCYWQLSGKGVPEDRSVFPDGHPEMLFHFGEPFIEICGERGQIQGRALFAGQMTGPLSLRSSTNVGCFAVRFAAAGVSQFTRCQMNQFSDIIVGLQDVFEDSGTFLRCLLSCETFEERVAIAEEFLLRRLRPGMSLAAQAVDRLQASSGGQSVMSIAGELGVTVRHLERQFAEEVGLSPKRFARVVRFQRALRLLETPDWSGAEAAHESGFCDQAHLIRDFVQFTGVTPSAYLRHRLELFAHTR